MLVGGQTEARAQLSSTIIDYNEPFDTETLNSYQGLYALGKIFFVCIKFDEGGNSFFLPTANIFTRISKARWNWALPRAGLRTMGLKKFGVNPRNLWQKFSFLVKTAIFYDFLRSEK